MKEPKSPDSTAWLWRLALLILLIGGGVSYMLSRTGQDTNSRTLFSVSMAVTIIGAGICVICATANWWMKR